MSDITANLKSSGSEPHPAQLKRALNLPLLTLYGLGTTVGAGIYVLVGATAAKAGIYAPVSFLLAAVVVAFTGLSYAEMGTRYPVSAGEAAYVGAGFSSDNLALVVGLAVALSGIVSAAAVSIGAAAYLEHFISLPAAVITFCLILLLGAAAAWGILESVIAAAIFTVIEIGGLALVIAFGIADRPELVFELGKLVPPPEWTAWSGIYAAGLLAFFAFVGFEDIANVAEEVRSPIYTLPRAIILTLAISTLIYVAVVAVVVLVVPMDVLKGSAAPLALVFENQGGFAKSGFSAIAIIATANGVLIQMIMASRVFYGLAAQGRLPALLTRVNPVTRTPLIATVLTVALILVFALLLPISRLAELTSSIILIVFASVNAALLLIKLRETGIPDKAIYQVPIWVPVGGVLTSLALLLSAAL